MRLIIGPCTQNYLHNPSALVTVAPPAVIWYEGVLTRQKAMKRRETRSPSTGLPRAGLLRRLGAMFYDSLLVLALLFVATAIAMPFGGGTHIARDNPLFPLYLLSVTYLFFAWFWIHGGQTLGMRAWRLRVQRMDGRPLGWLQSLLRFMAAIAALLPLGLGLWWLLFDREGLAWHDRFSESEVVVLPN